MDSKQKIGQQRDELDGVEMLFLADILSQHPNAAEYQELEQKLKRLAERYITTGK